MDALTLARIERRIEQAQPTGSTVTLTAEEAWEWLQNYRGLVLFHDENQGDDDDLQEELAETEEALAEAENRIEELEAQLKGQEVKAG